MSKYLENEIVQGCVTGIEKYGIFVTLDEYYSGLIHISEICDGYVNDINSVANIGETIRVRVIGVNEEDYHVNLSIKNLNYHINTSKNTKIKETPSGFNGLKNQLAKWIYMKKNKKK